MNNRQIKFGRRKPGYGRQMEKPTVRRGPELHLYGLGAFSISSIQDEAKLKLQQEQLQAQQKLSSQFGFTPTPGGSTANVTPMSPMIKTAAMAAGAFFLAKMLRLF